MTLLLILIFVFIFGLTIGSFLNCLIWRLHEKIPLTIFVRRGNKRNRSYCPKCGQQINWYDNIPLVSFIMLKGKCRQCGQSISWQYPAVEVTTGILFLISFLLVVKSFIINPQIFDFRFSIFDLIQNSKFIIQLMRDWFLISVMIVIFIYDLRWSEILDIVTLPACLAVFIINLVLGFNLLNLLISGIIGGSFFLIQFLVSGGRWIGGGDIRLGLLMGLALGWPAVLLAIIISYFIGSIVGVGLILAGKKKWGSEVPLGVFLATGTIISLFWQAQILNWYLGMF